MEENDDDQDIRETAAHIEEHGLSVIVIEGTDYLPSFAYSIGLWRKFNHPEVIAFGLTVETLHAIVNIAGDIVKEGRSIQTNKLYGDFFEGSDTQFVPVDKSNMKEYFGYAIDFYKTKEFPALQLIWTDRNNKFPWEPGFAGEFIYRQPLLDRNMDFKFREAKNLAVFTTKQWLEEHRPILQVIHEENGDWQFLTGDQMSEDIKLVALEQMTLHDPTLNDVFSLEYGEAAERTVIGGKWKRTKIESDHE